MYESNKGSDRARVRFSVGTEQVGLTYYLSRKRLKQSSTVLNSSGHLENNMSLKECYRLEKSYLTSLTRSYLWFWLTKSSTITPVLAQDDRTGFRPPRPFVDRVHDLTFRLYPKTEPWKISRYSALHFLIHLGHKKLFEGSTQWIAMSGAALLYGGLHLLAWNAPFHAPIYGLLWKISGITTASLGVARLVIPLAMYALSSCGDDSLSLWLLFLCWFALKLIYMVMFGFALLYVLARVYLVVESFLNLAYLPDSALTTPNFSLYFPHIG